MAHGVSEVLGEGSTVVKMLAASKQQQQQQQQPPSTSMQQSAAGNLRKSVGVMGSRRIFAPAFKLKVLDSYRSDIDCRGNQRATARKYGIHRRQIQKWLQCEENLRNCCSADGSSSSSGSSSNVATPAGSPQKELLDSCSPGGVAVPSAAATVPQQQHHHNGAPASPALNLSLARLHGDELAAAAAAQQHQPPPPPPPPSSSAQALATQHQPTAAAAANYRFHGAAATAAATQPTGYPDLKDKVLPIQQHYQPPADYSVLELYQPSLYHHQHHHQHHHRYFQPPTISYPVESPKLEEESYPRMSLLAPAEIKTERASPDSHRESLTPAVEPEKQQLKRERLDEEEHDFQRSASSSVSPPLPSHQHHLDYQHHHHHHHLEALPPSPQHSDRSTGCSSSDSEMDQQSGGPNAADLARRRSFSLRFKLDVLDAFHRDAIVAGNQRATARKFGINRRQVQKWLGQENELRGVIELCGSNNRQRLGPLQESPQTPYGPESPVDLRTSELDQVSPHQYQEYAVDSSLTPPYSAPGCSLSCCQESTPVGQTYYCYSPESTPPSLKRSLCTEPCCYLAPKRLCTEDKQQQQQQQQQPKEEEQPIQETPLCLVKPKRPADEPVSTPPAPAAQPSKKDAILFKPYLDNPVSKPNAEETSATTTTINNNNQEATNLNERPTAQADLALELSFKLPVSFRPPAPQQQQQQQQQQVQYPEYPQRSAFIRYPTIGVHYS